MGKVKRSQLVEGREYYLVNDNQHRATFVGREKGGIYFTMEGHCPYMLSSVEGREDQIGFLGNDMLGGFVEVQPKSNSSNK
jgi:hypothetical protein